MVLSDRSRFRIHTWGVSMVCSHAQLWSTCQFLTRLPVGTFWICLNGLKCPRYQPAGGVGGLDGRGIMGISCEETVLGKRVW